MPNINKGKRPWQPKHEPHARRPQRNDVFYHSSAWRKMRAHVLRQQPFCVECRKENTYTPATVVDHIVPINQGGARLDANNLQPMCDRHHNIKSANESKKK